jgi:SAM-dependent methyltransferase
VVVAPRGRPKAPHPPLQLANRVASLEGYDDPFARYDQLGAESREAILQILPEEWSFEGRRALDFGCGAGRTLAEFLDEAEGAEIWGCDIDDESIRWIQANLCPPLRAASCGPEPPLPFEDSSFDLIWAISVFTHLTDSWSAWLLEMHRILRPGGLLIATFMGKDVSDWLAGEDWDENRNGMNVLHHLAGWEDGGPLVLHSEWWVRAHWGRAFEILEIRDRLPNEGWAHSWALLRPRPTAPTREDLERPEPGEQREVEALRHNLRQVQAEMERAVRETEERAARETEERVARETAASYERSASWRLTRPLRAIRARRGGSG